MKKAIIVLSLILLLAFYVLLGLLGLVRLPGQGHCRDCLNHFRTRNWRNWEEMKHALGNHYLFPTYLPEVTERSLHVSKRPGINSGSRNRSNDELFFGYSVFYHGGRNDDAIVISAIDIERMDDDLPLSDYAMYESSLYERVRFNEHTVTLGGIDIEFFSVYGTFIPPDVNPDEWNTYHPRTGRIVHYTFTIDTVIYVMSWIQYDVEDKYADDEQREGMLRVAKSII